MTWFEPVAEFMGEAYLRYSFTKGTEQEVEFLTHVLDLQPGMRVLDVGCGPGRHAHALAAMGLSVHGVDISARFIDIARAGAPPGATFEVGDARRLAFDADFDVVLSLCQGAFGLVGAEDSSVLEGMAAAVRPGGQVAFTAFSAYFQIRFLEDGDRFDAAAGVNRERATVRNEEVEEREFEVDTSCFTPRELRLLCERSGLVIEAMWSVTPGRYERNEPDLEHPELLVIGRRPIDSTIGRPHNPA